MNAILAMPLLARMLLLALCGAALGALVNWVVDRIRWEPTFLSPWHPADAAAGRRRRHYLPVWGWMWRRHESARHGEAFWVRPLLVELGLTLALPALYWHETVRLGLVPLWQGAPNMALLTMLHAQYAGHVLLLAMMMIASLVDLDDKIIPDTVTVPGTLLGLALATALPMSLLPEVVADGKLLSVRLVTAASPRGWPAELAAYPNLLSLVMALGCFWIWCLGLLPRVWRTRRGLSLALAIFWLRLAREQVTRTILALGLLGAIGIGLAWRLAGDARWQALLSALVGLAVTGGFTWLVRVVAGSSIGREALGFGDVTLMSMIGAFVGWQAGLMVFFVAPFFGLALGLAQWALRRDPEIPYGPFLCLAAATIVLRWPSFWEMGREIFVLGWIVPAALLVMVLLMGAMLRAWHWVIDR